MELTSYDDVNNAWGGITLPPVTTKACAPYFAKLVEKFAKCEDRIGRPFVPGWARKGRRVWASPKAQDTSQHRAGGRNGLPRMIHDASHLIFEWKHPKKKTHCVPHAELEWQMIEYALRKGWHLPPAEKAKPIKPTAHQARWIKLDRTRAGIKRWESKAKRAETALRKLRRRAKALERHLAIEA
jgi:hypothetical protein